MDQTTFYQSRLKLVTELGPSAYPHKWTNTKSIQALLGQYSSVLENGDMSEDSHSISGRVTNSRESGKALIFFDLYSNGHKIQVLARKNNYHNEEEFATLRDIARGDIIGVKGHPCRSKRGEMSICPERIERLSHCLHMLPSEHFGLVDQETRYRQRYLDLMVNPQVRETFLARSKIVSTLRRYLEDLGFIEVETPVLNTIAGGATAKPFKTHHNELDTDMFLRIAPELPLKMAVIGGLEKVFEIGKQFRNEGMDLTHNPEFTTCEFYWAYQDYNDLMQVTEDLIATIVQRVKGSLQVEYGGKTIDFSPPYKRISMISELEKRLDVKLTNLHSEETRDQLIELCKGHGIDCPPPHTSARLLDRLVGALIEPECINPTFIIDHPLVMSPLAKWHRDNPELTERFELFVNGKEICNAYTELNSPLVQRERFAQQQRARQSGDDEVPPTDEDFCRALEYGLPPTAGWGMGIDRLTMLLTNNTGIKEVLLFPPTK